VGVSRTLRLLREAGMSTLDQPSGNYGLSLAIGTCGIRLLDLTSAYAGLAREGHFMPVRVRTTSHAPAGSPTPPSATIGSVPIAGMPAKGVQLLSSGASYLVTSSLANADLREPE